MNRSWTIQLDGYIAPSLNEYVHNRGVRFTAVKKLVKKLEPWTHPHSPLLIPPAMVKRIVRLTVQFGVGRRRFDTDNCQKIVKDALKNVGFIVNDSTDWCDCPETVVTKGLTDRTTIEIIELARDYAICRMNERVSVKNVESGAGTKIISVSSARVGLHLDLNEAKVFQSLLNDAIKRAEK